MIDIQLSLHPNKMVADVLCIVMSNPVTTPCVDVP